MFGESVLTSVSHVEARRVRFDKSKDCIGLVEVLTAFLRLVEVWRDHFEQREVEGGLQILEESVQTTAKRVGGLVNVEESVLSAASER